MMNKLGLNVSKMMRSARFLFNKPIKTLVQRSLSTTPSESRLTTLDSGFRVVSEPISEGYSTATVSF